MASSGRKRSLSGPCTSTPSKRKKYVCKYQQFWEKEFTWLQKSDTGEDMAHCQCKLCKTNFSVAAGALYDVKRHAEMIDIFTKDKRFPLLCTIAHLCLVVPISNADSERMFSMINKIVTEFRSELNNDTVSCLLCSKQNRE